MDEELHNGLTADHIEVENEKYHDKVCFVLPLSSGRLAVLHGDRRCYKIVDTWGEVVAATAEAVEHYRKTRPKPVQIVPAALLVGDSLLEDLGL